MSETIPEKNLVAPSYGRNGFFVGGVTNRQNRSPIDEMAPSPPQRARISDPRDTWDPKQASFTGSAFCMQTNLVSGRVVQNGPQDRENRVFGVFGPFRALNEISPDPKKPVNRELPGKILHTTQRRQS